IPTVTIPPEPQRRPPPVLPADPLTAASGVYVLRLPAVSKLGAPCRQLCVRAALLRCSADEIRPRLLEVATFVAQRASLLHRLLSMQAKAEKVSVISIYYILQRSLVAARQQPGDLLYQGRTTGGEGLGMERCEREDTTESERGVHNSGITLGEGVDTAHATPPCREDKVLPAAREETPLKVAGAMTLEKDQWSWIEEEWRQALSGAPPKLGDRFDPLQVLRDAIPPGSGHVGTPVPPPSPCPPNMPQRIEPGEAWNLLMCKLVKEARTEEVAGALWWRWELQDEDVIIAVDEEEKQSRERMWGYIKEHKLEKSKDMLQRLDLMAH
ncbi:hypothetical protein CYMTET_22751, partial [Cymbomonas tetramitiformis]